MSTTGKWLLRLSLTALAMLLTTDRRPKSAATKKPAG
jgi:hypothetical protein